MLRRALSVCAVLGFVSAAHAGVAITLVPHPSQPGEGYQPGEVLNVDILAQLTSGTPSLPGPAGTTTAVRVRLMQFDLADSDAALGISTVDHHPLSDLGPIPFWDFGGSTGCANDETACGFNYFIDGSIASDDILNITYIGTTTSGGAMITLNQTAQRRVGQLTVTLPTDPGTYLLDVLNADEVDINQGAELRWGFGSVGDPTDPTSPLRANGGGISGGQVRFTVIPEPATLALLGLGGVAAALRRRRTA
jgi:hypothetical protein